MDSRNDPIAITIPRFSLLKKADRFDRYSEPYIVSMAFDANDRVEPVIDFNFMPFPKVAKGGTVTMLGDGHLIYGPANPGEFLAMSVLIMECDHDIRAAGRFAEEALRSSAADLAMKALLSANPGAYGVVSILKELTGFIAARLKANKDDELFRISGSFLRGHPVPYHVGREYEHSNDYVAVTTRVIPLASSNGQGPCTKKIAV